MRPKRNCGPTPRFLVVETKGGLFADDLRDSENAKIACGREHFKALERGDSPARFVKASRLDDVLGSS